VSGIPGPGGAGGGTGGLARRAVALAALVLALATPVATWWLVDDQSTVPVSVGRDYAFRPWDIGPEVARAAGIGSLLLVVAMIMALAWATRRHLLDARWWTVLIPLLAAGVIAGAGCGHDGRGDRGEHRCRTGRVVLGPGVRRAGAAGAGTFGVPAGTGAPRQEAARRPEGRVIPSIAPAASQGCVLKLTARSAA